MPRNGPPCRDRRALCSVAQGLNFIVGLSVVGWRADNAEVVNMSTRFSPALEHERQRYLGQIPYFAGSPTVP
jgi:hypothetical protein